MSVDTTYTLEILELLLFPYRPSPCLIQLPVDYLRLIYDMLVQGSMKSTLAFI